MGAQLVMTLPKANDEAGDGTTTATVLAQAIVNEGLKAAAAGMNPMDPEARHRQGDHRHRRRAEAAGHAVHRPAAIAQVGTISTTPTSPSARIIAEAMERVGKQA